MKFCSGPVIVVVNKVSCSGIIIYNGIVGISLQIKCFNIQTISFFSQPERFTGNATVIVGVYVLDAVKSGGSTSLNIGIILKRCFFGFMWGIAARVISSNGISSHLFFLVVKKVPF